MNEWRDGLLAALQDQRAGLTRAQLQAAVHAPASAQQNVVRALRALKAEGLVRFEGHTRARRYWLEKAGAGKRPLALSQGELPLSAEGRSCLDLVSRPLHARQPVGYRREFLDAYRVGKTYYLPRALRERLAALGRTPAAKQPAGTYARHVLERLLLDLSWNSSRLEGNTYSLLDTERLLAAGTTAEGKSLLEAQMLLNHKAAIEFVVAEPMTAALDGRTVKTLHALLMENLLSDRLDEGRLRSTPVQIGASVYLPLANPQLVDECFRQVLHIAARIDDPFECSFFLLVHLPYLQPFLDGNKRTARLAANLPFVLHNLVPLSFTDVPRDLFLKAYLAVYETTRVDALRDVYVWAYERSAKRLGQIRSSLGEPDPFRLKHRGALRQVVADFVRAKVPPASRRARLERFGHAHLPQSERERFVELAELEFEGLHEGNFARYGLRPSEFAAWQTLAQPRKLRRGPGKR
jgi:fido (protein-threonine AMPylation protein)